MQLVPIKTPNMRTLSLLLMLTVVFTSVQAQDCSGADHTILAGNLYFNPADLTINAGETVAWVNEGGFHDVNGVVSVLTGESFGNPENFSLPSVSGDASGVCMGTHTFTVPGTYNYDCSIGNHAASGMVGSITVTAPPSGCNDELACNYDADATSDVDCLYDDGTLDLSQGIWVMATAYLTPGSDCSIEPAQGLLVNMTADNTAPLTIDNTDELSSYINNMVTDGLLDGTSAAILNAAFANAGFSFCNGYLTGLAGTNAIEADWDGTMWSLPLLGFTLVPAAEMPSGCSDPDALNFDPCAHPDDSLCEYTAAACSDPLACNYDSTSTGTADCIYDDGTFDFDAGFWLVPAAALDPNFDCDIQPGAGVQVGVLDDAGSAVTVVVDAALQDFVDAGVASGLLTSLEAALLIGALNVATFSFCENTMTGIAGSTTIVSEWNGQSWSIESLGINLAPVSTLSPGCGNPDALNYDPCTNPDESLCQYTALACDDPLACNYDSTSTGAADCIYFDTGLFSLEENDFIGLTDFEDCETGYPGAYSLPVPLVQDSLGGPLTFVLFPDVESFLVDNGFGIAAQDLATVTMSVCDTVMNYNSDVLGDLDLYWDGLGFTVDVYGSFFAPESSFPIGCPDPDACNFDACSHPFVTDDCTYVFEGPITTAAGDTGFVEFTGDPITFIANVADGITGTWFTDCGGLPPEIDGNTLTLVDPEVGDCEICFDAGSEDCLQTECIIVSVVGSVGETGTAAWSLMPNPAASDLRIEWGGETAVFEVFDLNGRRVHTATLQPGTQVLDVSRLQPGLYLAGPQGAAPRRLAIQR